MDCVQLKPGVWHMASQSTFLEKVDFTRTMGHIEYGRIKYSHLRHYRRLVSGVTRLEIEKKVLWAIQAAAS